MSLDPDFSEEQKSTKSLQTVHNILKALCLNKYQLLNNSFTPRNILKNIIFLLNRPAFGEY